MKQPLAVAAGLLLATLLLCVRHDGGDQAHDDNHTASVASTSVVLTPAYFSHVPLVFEPRRDRAGSHAQFVAHGTGYTLTLSPTKAAVALNRVYTAAHADFAGTNSETVSTLVIRLVGANPNAELLREDALPGKSHYFTGKDPEKWRTGIPHYARVRYKEIYPGVDVVYYGNPNRLEYDFVVAPGADPAAIRLRFDGHQGVRIDEDGSLALRVDDGEVLLRAPRIYQETRDGRRRIDGGFFAEADSIFGFALGEYDASVRLVIDPELVYSTFHGGSGSESGKDIAVDADGNAYITGSVTDAGATYAFVTKLSADGSTVLYSTQVGGSLGNYGFGIAVDREGNAYVTGETLSDDFPTPNGFDHTLDGTVGFGARDAFLAKFDSDGILVYGTYLGGDGDEANGEHIDVAVDKDGKVYVAGETESGPTFPTRNGFQNSPSSGGLFGESAFLSVFDLSLSGDASLIYSTFLGGNDDTEGRAVAVDTASGIAYVAGITQSTDFPLRNPFQSTPPSPSNDIGFIARLDASMSGDASLLSSTYFGGGQFGSTIESLALDGRGGVYVVGFLEFPGIVPSFVGGGGREVAKLNHDVTELVYFADELPEAGKDIVADAQGQASVAFSSSSQTNNDVAVATLNAEGTDTLFTFRFGSRGNVGGLAVDAAGNLFLAGSTNASDFPTVSPAQSEIGGSSDAIVAKIGAGPTAIIVNDVGDDDDVDPGDDICDVDAGQVGNQCTLRAAIQTANADPGRDRIEFELGEGATITPNSALPPITEAVTIDGRTEGIVVAKHSAVASRTRISGANLGRESALTVTTPRGKTTRIKGFEIHSFRESAILIENVSDVVIGGTAPMEGNALWDNAIGLQIQGENATNIRVVGNCFGAPDCSDPPDNNLQIGISITDNASGITIGGMADDEGNTIFGGITTFGTRTEKITVLNNELEVPLANLTGPSDLRVPLDLNEDGPSCFDWNGGSGPDGRMTPPRVLSLTQHQVAGRTEAGATVEVYKVIDSGVQRGRYFPRHVKPVARGTADGTTGAFSIAVSTGLDPDDLITVTATDKDGNTSELAQVRRPIVFVPGIGGSTLQDANGNLLWLPAGSDDDTQNDNLARLALQPDGSTSPPSVPAKDPNDPQIPVAGPITVKGVLEETDISGNPEVTEQTIIYGHVLSFLDKKGYPGDKENKNTLTNDLWRYAYDWRLDLVGAANGLKDLIHRVTGDEDDVAKSCEVDMIAHSMGGLVSSLYLRTNPSDSESRVHRFVSMAVPYLGTPQGIAAHTVGYIFELEDQRLYGWFYDVDWNRMLQMTRNMPAAYALVPSSAYWDAAIPKGKTYLTDLKNNPLPGYKEVFDFVTADKTTDEGFPQGLGRNADLWRNAQNRVHAHIDDWRTWQGPPQVFRLVGDLQNPRATTAYRWQRTARSQIPFKGRRYEEGDHSLHSTYRATLEPWRGRGDGTVSLSSATLGHIPLVGTDFSGVDGPWIEDFELFDCKHFDIVNIDDKEEEPACGVVAVRRMLAIIKTGYTVPASTPKLPTKLDEMRNGQEIFYVYGGTPLAVDIRDSQGRTIGPIDNNTNKIRYEIPKPIYAPNDGVTAASLPSDDLFEVTVRASEQPGRTQVIRIFPSDGDLFEQVLFPDLVLESGGGIQWTADPTSQVDEVRVDADGDGTFEATVTPVATLASSSSGPSIPVPHPSPVYLEAQVEDTWNPQATIILPDLGGPAWQWTAESGAGWIVLNKSNGETPDEIVLTLAATALPLGIHVDTVRVNLSYEGSLLTYPVAVHLNVVPPGSPAVADVTPDNAVQGATGVQLSVEGRNFVDGTTISFSGTGIAVTSTLRVSPNELRTTIDVEAGAVPGPRDVIATNPDGPGIAAPGAFEVLPRGSLVALLSWDPPAAGETLLPPRNLTVTFDAGAVPAKAPAREANRLGAPARTHSTAKRLSRSRQVNAGASIEELEPNDAPEQAQVLSGTSPLQVNGSAEVEDQGGLVITFGEGDTTVEDDIEDLFLVTTTSPGLYVLLDGFSSDCDLYLIDMDASVVIDLSASIGASGDELIDQPSLPEGTYLIGVSIYDDDPIGPPTTPYLLTVEGEFEEVGSQPVLTSYNIYRSLTPAAFTSGSSVGSVAATTTTYSDALPSNGFYYYQVTAVYDQGESDPSDESTLLVGVAVEEGTPPPTDFRLGQNYPNPFSPVTTIPYEVAVRGRVTLTVYDLLGRKVATLVDAVHAPGSFVATFDGRGMPAGLYLYDLVQGSRRLYRTMLLLK